MKTGLFAGLVTLDCIYQTHEPLGPNEKQVADAMLLAAGGPATNAAIAFQALGSRAILVGALGRHPLTTVIHEDLAQQGIDFIDLTPDATVPPPFSSIIVNTETGDRAVISRNATDRPHPPGPPPPELLAEADCLLIDGHQMDLSRHLAQQAQPLAIPVVVDAGSWKPRFDTVLPLATQVIASANFCPPGGTPGDAAIAYLASLNIPNIAVTQGSAPILYQTPNRSGQIPVPTIQAVDTLGAGDIFHGAFCHYVLNEFDFIQALTRAAQVASHACQFFGTRTWIREFTEDETSA